MKRIFLVLVLGIFSAIADAALITQVSFAQRTGTVRPDEIVEVWVTLSVDSQSDPLYFDHLAPAPYFGLNPEIVPTSGQVVYPEYDPAFVPFSDWEQLIGGISFVPCGAAPFIAVCGGTGNYTYVPNEYRREDTYYWYSRFYGPNSDYPNQTFLLNPGESKDFLALAFQPIDGMASAGTFEMPYLNLQLLFLGEDENRDQINGRYSLGSICESRASECSFTRTVVPIPAAFWLFGSALGLLGWVRRRAS